jgi:hypothetical protein
VPLRVGVAIYCVNRTTVLSGTNPAYMRKDLIPELEVKLLDDCLFVLLIYGGCISVS